MTRIHRVLLKGCKKLTRVDDLDGFFSKIVMPWYLKGFENSMNSARSGFIVSGATIKSARSETISPINPVHSFFTPNVLERFFNM